MKTVEQKIEKFIKKLIQDNKTQVFSYTNDTKDVWVFYYKYEGKRGLFYLSQSEFELYKLKNIVKFVRSFYFVVKFD